MAGWIPDEKLSEIRNASDIVEVISEVVLLKKAGRNYLGLCPFHTEKTPSFTVSPEKQIFYCFGCGAGGNLFGFLMQHQGLSFPEAVKTLAERCGVTLPEASELRGRPHGKTDRERILEINRLAMDYYHRNLVAGPEGKQARTYLLGRGIPEALMETFRLGYAPGGWEHFFGHLKRKRIPQKAAFDSGLVVPRKNGSGGYDRFRNRIVFPILDLGGQAIGFGGRVLDDSLPKYINSSETPVFQKGRSLYGLDRARTACRKSDSVFIVEGYFDVITLHQHGLENVVAPLGTGLTPEHILLLKGFAQQFFLVFDPDEAGIKAVERIIPNLIRENVKTRVVALPEGKDPDAFVLEKGGEAFLGLAGRSLPVMDFLLELAKNRHGLSAQGKSRIVSDLEGVLASIDDGVNRSIFVKDVAEKIRIEEAVLLERIRRRRLKDTTRHPAADGLKTSEEDSESFSGPRQERFENKILSMMLQYPVMIPEIKRRRIVERFAAKNLKEIGEAILAYRGASEVLVPELITQAGDPETGTRIAQLASGEESWNVHGCQKLLEQFESQVDRAEKLSLNVRIRAAQEKNDHALLAALLKEKQKTIHNRK